MIGGFDPEEFVPQGRTAFRVHETAKLLSIDRKHVLKLIAQGVIAVPPERIASARRRTEVLIPRESLIEFLQRRRNSDSRLREKAERAKRAANASQSPRRVKQRAALKDTAQ